MIPNAELEQPIDSWRRLQRGTPALASRRVGGSASSNPWATTNLPAPGAPMVRQQPLAAKTQVPKAGAPGWPQPGPPAYSGAPPATNQSFDDWWARTQQGILGPGPMMTEAQMAQLLMGMGSGWRPPTGPFARGGDPLTRQSIQAEGARIGRGLQGQAVSAANLGGVDPAMRQWMQMQALMNGGAASAQAQNDYAMESDRTSEQMIRNAWLDFIQNWATMGPDWRRAEMGAAFTPRNNTGGTGRFGFGIGPTGPTFSFGG